MLSSIVDVTSSTTLWVDDPEVRVVSVDLSPRCGSPKKIHPTSGTTSQALSLFCAQAGPDRAAATTQVKNTPLPIIRTRIAPPRTGPAAPPPRRSFWD